MCFQIGEVLCFVLPKEDQLKWNICWVWLLLLFERKLKEKKVCLCQFWVTDQSEVRIFYLLITIERYAERNVQSNEHFYLKCKLLLHKTLLTFLSAHLPMVLALLFLWNCGCVVVSLTENQLKDQIYPYKLLLVISISGSLF